MDTLCTRKYNQILYGTRRYKRVQIGTSEKGIQQDHLPLMHIELGDQLLIKCSLSFMHTELILFAY
jgi:hypothetical protein